MDNYDSFDEPAERPGLRFEPWDLISLLVLVTTACLAVYFLILFINPSIPYNPLPPNQANPYAPPTFTITPIKLEATWTPTVVNTTETPTLLPTITLQASPTGFSLLPTTKTPKPTSTPQKEFSATVSYIDSTIIHPDSACNWQGVGGTVVDVNNADIFYQYINLVGTYNGKSVGPGGVSRIVSGVNPDYGRSGFEFFLSTAPISSNHELYLQIVDQTGYPLSDNIYINTYNDCEKNLVLVRFKKNR